MQHFNGLESMIKKRDFYHQNIKYSFGWNFKNHNEKLSQINPNWEEVKKLQSFLKKVYQGAIPNDLFNRKDVQRISQFKIRGLKNAFLRSFGKKLIRSGRILVSESSSKLTDLAKNVHITFNNNQLSKSPGHNPILKNILIKDKDSIAIEIPIWINQSKLSITGHIDLIQIQDNTIKVIDYKPEGNFLFSIPQVAMYGFLIKKNLNIKDLKCISFNKNENWEYDPEILITEIKNYLISQKIPRIWENFLI
jgi:hypothetical protein